MINIWAARFASRGGGFWLACAAVLLGLALRFFLIDGKPLWNDEAFTLRVVQLPFREITPAIRLDVHPPVYFLLLHGWLQLLPQDVNGRIFSALFGGAALVLVAAFARRLLDWPRSALAVALAAMAPLLLAWSQLGRSYALLAFVTLFLLLASARFLSALETRTVGIAWAWGALTALSGALALWIHNLAALAVLSANVVALIRLVDGRLSWRFGLIAWSAAQLTLIALWSPWWGGLLEQSSRLDGEHFLVPVSEFLKNIGDIFGGFLLWDLRYPAALITAGAAVCGLLQLPRRQAETEILVASVVVPVLFCIAAFFAGERALGYLIDKLIWVPAMLAVAVAAALRWPVGRGAQAALQLAGVALLCGALLMAGRGASNWLRAPAPAWDEMAARIAAEAGPGDVVLAVTDLFQAEWMIARGETPLHSLVVYAQRLHAAGRPLPTITHPGHVDDAGLRDWLGQQRVVWVPAMRPMGADTAAMRAVAIARAQQEFWRVEERPVFRLGLFRLERR
jgi:hypothetical protein